MIKTKKEGAGQYQLPLSKLSKADSNHHKQNQNLLCYHYTIGQSQLLIIQFAAAKVVLFHSTTKYFCGFLLI